MKNARQDEVIRLSSRIFSLSLNRIAQLGIAITDVVMMGWLGSDALAAGSLANGIWALLFSSALGFLMAILPLAGSAHGAGQHELVQRVMQNSMIVATLMAAFSAVIMLAVPHLIETVHNTKAITELAQEYLYWSVASYFPFFWILALRNYLVCIDRIAWINKVSFFAFILNCIGNWALGFGHLGLPEMGLAGIGLSTSLTALISFLLLWASLRLYPESRAMQKALFRFRWYWDVVAELLRIGGPTALILLVEAGLLAGSSVIVSSFGVEKLAAYGLAVQFFSLALMVPIAASQAASGRIGVLVGERDIPKLIFVSWLVLAITLTYSIVVGTLYATQSNSIARLLSNHAKMDEALIFQATSLLPLIGLAQLFAGLVIVIAAVLRGLREASSALLNVVVCYWGFGLISALISALIFDFGSKGVWVGINFGFFTAFISLAFKLYYRLNHIDSIINNIHDRDEKHIRGNRPISSDQSGENSLDKRA